MRNGSVYRHKKFELAFIAVDNQAKFTDGTAKSLDDIALVNYECVYQPPLKKYDSFNVNELADVPVKSHFVQYTNRSGEAKIVLWYKYSDSQYYNLNESMMYGDMSCCNCCRLELL